jgi:7,8-dihydroneopterin aldolase/epimerase/oxygenase
MTADRVQLLGIAAFGYHGVLDHERREGQPFVIDVTAWTDLSAAAATDDLADTLDYGALASQVVAAVERDPVDLIETLAARIADLVLVDERVSVVEVTVHKPQAPVAVTVADVSVTLTRSRG